MKKLKFIFIPVIAVGAILTTAYVLVNRESYTYHYDLMEKDSNLPGYNPEVNGQLKMVESLEDATKLITSNSKFVLYIGWANCGDCTAFRNSVIPLLSKKDVPLYYVDRADYTNQDGKLANEWYKTFGSYDMEMDADNLKNYRFAYTPTINLVIDGTVIESFWQFGGPGKELTTETEKDQSAYRSRYFRRGSATDEQKEQGFKNAASDVDALLNKWSKY